LVLALLYITPVYMLVRARNAKTPRFSNSQIWDLSLVFKKR
jgi:hypothetical protein